MGAIGSPTALREAGIEIDHPKHEIDHPKHDYLAPHGGGRGMGEVLVQTFAYTVAARYLVNSEDMVQERCSRIEAGDLGDEATEGLNDVDSVEY